MILFLVVIGVLYASFTIALAVTWWKIPMQLADNKTVTDSFLGTSPRITVVIPVRNETANLPALLNDLNQQTYPNFEVIVADDASTDNTLAIAQTFVKNSKFQLTALPLADIRTASPKKRAITESIGIATGDLILTTDGDCRVGPNWIAAFADFYQKYQPKMITGPVTFLPSKTVFGALQTVEFASLIGSGACTLAWGRPTMCNGANLCYEKRVFAEVGGFAGVDHLASGDDELLMHKIAEHYPNGVRFLKNQAAIVQTDAHRSLVSFYNQRKRWASKWRTYRSWQPSALAVFVFLSNAAPVLALVGWLAGWWGGGVVVAVAGLKVLPEVLFLGSILVFLQKKWAVSWILPTAVVYPFYVIFFGLAAQRKGYHWKGRKLE
jgi:cellulose synthase/poly-beta-1,6-N-acetylglucosamine synthase-like glycosyltransferase